MLDDEHPRMTAPFVPRPPSEPAWWARPATAEEMEAVERERAAMERLLREARMKEGKA